MFNIDIRTAIKEAKIRGWQVADKLEMQDSNFSRKLRKELSQKEKEKIFLIIKELKKEREEKTNDEV